LGSTPESWISIFIVYREVFPRQRFYHYYVSPYCINTMHIIPIPITHKSGHYLTSTKSNS
jgi:hypothetical protein